MIIVDIRWTEEKKETFDSAALQRWLENTLLTRIIEEELPRYLYTRIIIFLCAICKSRASRINVRVKKVRLVLSIKKFSRERKSREGKRVSILMYNKVRSGSDSS